MLSSIQITDNFQQIYDEYKNFKYLVYNEMCEKDQQSLNKIENDLINSISLLLQEKNPINQEDNKIRALIGVKTLSKYTILNQEKCTNFLSEINSSFPQSIQKKLFFFKCIAKLCKKSPNYIWDNYLTEFQNKILPMSDNYPSEIQSIENALIYIYFIVKYAPLFLSKFSKEIILHLLKIIKENNYIFDSNYDILSKTNKTLIQYFIGNEKFYANNAIDLIRKILIQIKSIRYQTIKVNNILVSEPSKKLKYLALLSVLLQTCGKSFIETNFESIQNFLNQQENDQEMQCFITRNLIYCLKNNELPNELLSYYLYSFDDDLSSFIICCKLQNLKLFISLNHLNKNNQQQIFDLALNFISNEDETIRTNALDLLNTFCLSIDETDKMELDLQTVFSENEIDKNFLKFNELVNLKFDSDPLTFIDELSESINNYPLETLLFLNGNEIEKEKENEFKKHSLINTNEIDDENEDDFKKHSSININNNDDENYVVKNLKDESIVRYPELYEKVIQSIFDKNENQNCQVRSLVPLVMAKLEPKTFFSNDYHLQRFIGALFEDNENQVKLSILQSFNYLFALDEDIDYIGFIQTFDCSINRLFDSLINDSPSENIKKEAIKLACSLAKNSETIPSQILENFKKIYSEFSEKSDFSILHKKMALNSEYLSFVIDALPSFYNDNFESFFDFLFGFMNMKVQSKTLFQLTFYEKIFCSYSKIFRIILRINPSLIEPHIDQLIEFCMKSLYCGLSELETQNILSLLEKCLYHIGLEKTIEINDKKVFDEHINLYKIVYNTGIHFVSPLISKLVFKVLSFIGPQTLYEKQRIINLETEWRDEYKNKISDCKYIASQKIIFYAICSDLLYKILDDQSASSLHLKSLEILLNILNLSNIFNSIVQSEVETIFRIFKKMLVNSSNDKKSQFVPFLKLFVDLGLSNVKFICKDLIECLIELWDFGSSSLLITFAYTLKMNLYPYLNQIIPKVLELDDPIKILSSLQINCIIINSKETLSFDIIKILIDMVNKGKYEALQALNEIIPSAHNLDKYIPLIIDTCLKSLNDYIHGSINNDDDDEYYYEEEEDKNEKLRKIIFNNSVNVLQSLAAKSKVFNDTEIIFNKHFPKIKKMLASYPKELDMIKNISAEQCNSRNMTFVRRSFRRNNDDPNADNKKEEFLDFFTSIRNVISSDDNYVHIQQWLNELVLFCISESPNSVIKSMLPIAQINPSFALSIFNIAFFAFLKKFDSFSTYCTAPKQTEKPKPKIKKSSQTFISIMNDARLLAKAPQVKKNGLLIVDGSQKKQEPENGMAIPLTTRPKIKTIKDKIKPITETLLDLLLTEKIPSQCKTILSNLVEFLDRAGIPVFDLDDFEDLRRPLSTIFSNNPPLALRFTLLNYMKYKKETSSKFEDMKQKAATDLEQAFLNNGFYDQCQNFRNLNQNKNDDNDNYLIPIQANTVENIYRLQNANKFFNMKNWDRFNNEIDLCDRNSISHLFKAASLIQQYWEKTPNEQNNTISNDIIYDYSNHFESKNDNNSELKLQILNEIEMGFNSLGDENQASFSHSNSLINQSILYGQQFIELQEMFLSNGNINNFMLRFLKSKNQISKLLHPILLLRIASKSTNKNSLAEKVGLLSVCRRSMDWDLMNKYYKHFFDSCSEIPVEIEYEMTYNKLVNGNASESEINKLLEKVQSLIEQNKTSCLNGEYEYQTLEKYVKYQKALFYSNSFNEATKFKEVLLLCKDFDDSKAINLWSWANLKLFEIENEIDYFKPKFKYKSFKLKKINRNKNEGLEAQNTNSLISSKRKEIDYKYLIEAIKGYIKCELINNKMIGQNMVLIISLLFNHFPNTKHINEIKDQLNSLPLYFYLDSVPIIISYIHQIKKNDFGSFVIDLLIELMKKYPRGVIYDYSFSLICDKRKKDDNDFILSPIEDVKNYFIKNPEKLQEKNCQNIFNEVEELTNNLYNFSNNIITIIYNFLKYALDFLDEEISSPHQENEIENFIDDLNYMKEEYFIPLSKFIKKEDQKDNDKMYQLNIIEQMYATDTEFTESLKRLSSKIDEIIYNLNQLIDNRNHFQQTSNIIEKMKKKIEKEKELNPNQNRKTDRLAFSENPQNIHLKVLEQVDNIALSGQFDVSDSLEYEGTMSVSSHKDIHSSFPHIFVENESNKLQHAQFILSAKLNARNKSYSEKNKDFEKLFEYYKSKIEQIKSAINGKNGICDNLSKFKRKLKNKIPSQDVTHDFEQEDPEMFKKFQNLSLPMFGTFRYDEKEPILIKSFDSKYTELSSLARPKKISLLGSDGKHYSFMLKSTEDLRVDQRNMILFKFMNRFLKTKIRTYSVTPLTVQIGVMQFVQQSKAVIDLITENRNRNNVKDENNVIYNKYLGMNEIYDDLDHDRKLLILNNVINETPNLGNDLSESMYLMAPDTQTWAKYTLNFSKTCAVTSIVGYIIGIGDRHLSNIMINMIDGSVFHIDFTDCFEINQRRSNLPEKVPFRLTRNIESMLGPCGYNGTFRSSCEETLALIRENREMIFNILEVFYISPIQVFGSARDIRRNLNEVKLTSNKNKFIMKRIKMKLDGTDSTIIYDDKNLTSENEKKMSVSEQVEKLIEHASNLEYLAYAYSGWQPWV